MRAELVANAADIRRSYDAGEDFDVREALWMARHGMIRKLHRLEDAT